MTKSVCVVGAGVIGMGTGVCIQESLPGVQVTVISDKFSPDTTSDIAGGLWAPHEVAQTPVHLMQKWSNTTFKYLADLVKSEYAHDAGVHLASGYHVFKEEIKDPDWKGSVYGFRTITEDSEEMNLFPGYKHAWFFTSIMCEGPRYIPWLTARFHRNGGKTIKRKLNTLDELAGKYDVIVNCSGLGAYSLVDDKTMYPVRGQLLRVDAPWIKHFVAFDDYIYYILPGDKTIALGGTHQRDDWRTTNDEEDCQRVFKECCKLVPSLRRSKPILKLAGSRPGRPTVRLEKQRMVHGRNEIKIVHNYGHGGAGITLHWGCAQHATELVQEYLQEKNTVFSKL
ncbi:D-aspartate oxidase-like [Saccoglossus kowalevskii]